MFLDISFGWCTWDLPALLLVVAMTVVFVVHQVQMRRRERKFEDELADRMANELLNRK